MYGGNDLYSQNITSSERYRAILIMLIIYASLFEKLFAVANCWGFSMTVIISDFLKKKVCPAIYTKNVKTKSEKWKYPHIWLNEPSGTSAC